MEPIFPFSLQNQFTQSHLSFWKLDLQHRVWQKTANDKSAEARDTSHVGPCFKGHITEGLRSIAQTYCI